MRLGSGPCQRPELTAWRFGFICVPLPRTADFDARAWQRLPCEKACEKPAGLTFVRGRGIFVRGRGIFVGWVAHRRTPNPRRNACALRPTSGPTVPRRRLRPSPWRGRAGLAQGLLLLRLRLLLQRRLLLLPTSAVHDTRARPPRGAAAAPAGSARCAARPRAPLPPRAPRGARARARPEASFLLGWALELTSVEVVCKPL